MDWTQMVDFAMLEYQHNMKGLEVWKMTFPFRLSFSRGHVDFSGVEQVDPKSIIGENFVTNIWKFLCESMPCTVYVYIYI